jgi:hypothetical protein
VHVGIRLGSRPRDDPGRIVVTGIGEHELAPAQPRVNVDFGRKTFLHNPDRFSAARSHLGHYLGGSSRKDDSEAKEESEETNPLSIHV